MEGYLNILDESILQDNIKFASLFIMNFECLKDYFVSQMRDFFSNDSSVINSTVIDGKPKWATVKKPKDEIKQLYGKNKLKASLLWFKEIGAISQEDIELVYKVRERRNSITHELISELMNGFSGQDAELFVSMLELYKKVDNWWIKEIEISISGEDYGEEYNLDSALGSQALILSLINDVALGNGDAYKELLEIFRKEYDDSKK